MYINTTTFDKVITVFITNAQNSYLYIKISLWILTTNFTKLAFIKSLFILVINLDLNSGK